MSRKDLYRRSYEQPQYWTSFTDIMTTIALVFFFVMLIGITFVTIRERNVTNEFNRIRDTYAEIDNIAQQRTELYEKIEKTLKGTAVGSNVIFNREKGRLEINAKTLYSPDGYNLTIQGRELAVQLAEAFDILLSDTEYQSKITSIEIRGHTDNTLDGEYNRSLSTSRAVTFVNAMIPKGSDLETRYGKYFKASGMSKFEMVAGTVEKQTEAERALNRRIEVYINFDDSDISEAIIKLLQSQKSR